MAAYGTLEGAAAYHEARGNADWASDVFDDAQRAAALLRGSESLDALYVARFLGTPTEPAQEREWPRRCVTYRGADLAEDAIPPTVEFAAYSLALLELQKPGSTAPNRSRGGKIKTATAGSASVTFMDDAPAGVEFTGIDGLLIGLLKRKNGGFSVGRVARA